MNDSEFNEAVTLYHEGLYRFGLSLARNEQEARDLVQETYLKFATKGHQLRDRTKLKTWLFTTLYREFLGGRRRDSKFHKEDLDSLENELPAAEVSSVDHMDAALVLVALKQVDEIYRAPLSLYYMEDWSYKQIAESLGVPIGTVMSRLSRGKAHLRAKLEQVTREQP